ncbi:response regulator [Granulosicoccaceae sp. 1_MG-2023]|nr:response regulator [Granulosicoccaceae sp. 1_MG-2023]
MPQAKLLIIDDEPVYAGILQRSLERHALTVSVCTDPDEAVASATAVQPDYIVLDLRLESVSGLTLIEPLIAAQPAVKILVLTGYSSLATAVQAIKLGAVDYLPKPAEVSDILRALGLSGDEAGEAPPIADKPVSLKRLEWEQIQRVLAENDGNITRAAEQLGMYRRTLQRKLQKKPQKL